MLLLNQPSPSAFCFSNLEEIGIGVRQSVCSSYLSHLLLIGSCGTSRLVELWRRLRAYIKIFFCEIQFGVDCASSYNINGCFVYIASKI